MNKVFTITGKSLFAALLTLAFGLTTPTGLIAQYHAPIPLHESVDGFFIKSVSENAIQLKTDRPNAKLDGYKIINRTEWTNQPLESRSSVIELGGLEPGTIYEVSLAISTEAGSDTVRNIPIVTSSRSSGEILVYFNSSVNTGISTGPKPVSTVGTVLRNRLLQLIDEAEYTLDVAAYNNNRSEIVDALIAAYYRGVRVRYIAEGENANTALNRSLPFEVLERNDNDGIMHHKFVIADADHEDISWVFTGSTNLTTQQIATDNNNSLFIQDQSLAKIYEMEFEEMWGSNTETPNPASSRFGENKASNTPQFLEIGNVPTQIYFSPSDNTAWHISNALQDAEESISFALLIFTFNPLAETLISKHFQGLNVRGLIHDVTSTGTRFPKLQSNNMNVHQDQVNGVQLHHKYALIDADAISSQPKVITGSHNWTNRANNHNDENTLILHSDEIANIYRQEFEARWCENVPDECVVNTYELIGKSSGLFSVFPNPSVSTTNVEFSENFSDQPYTFMVFDRSGKIIKSGFRQINSGVFQLSNLPTGSHFLRIDSNGQTQTIQIVIQN